MPPVTGADPTTESLTLNSTEPLGQTVLVTFAFNATWSLYCPATEATVVVVGALTVTLNEFVVVEPSILVPLAGEGGVSGGKEGPGRGMVGHKAETSAESGRGVIDDGAAHARIIVHDDVGRRVQRTGRTAADLRSGGDIQPPPAVDI